MEASALVYVTLTLVTVFIAMTIENSSYVTGRISGRRKACVPYVYTRENARNTVAETAIFILLAAVSACRIAVGNDYWVYRDNFKLIAQERHVSSEFGFNLVVKFMQSIFGYDNYLPIFGLFSIVTAFFFVKALHDQATDYAMSLFLLMTGGYYFNSLNSVRYYLALAIALYSMKYVMRREYLKFLTVVFVGAMFHKSIILVVPVYIIADWLSKTKIRKWHFALGGALVLSLIFLRGLYREIIFFFYPFYENSAFDTGHISYVNIAKCLGAIVLCAICYRRSIKDNPTNRFYLFLNIGALLVYSLGSFIPEVSRVGYYMLACQIFLIPGLLKNIEKGIKKNVLTAGVVLAFSAYFIILLKNMYTVDVRLLPYLNWIFN